MRFLKMKAMRILIFEAIRNDISRRLYKSLRRKGSDVVVANTLSDVCERIDTLPFDLLVLNIPLGGDAPLKVLEMAGGKGIRVFALPIVHDTSAVY
jgi:ActR/RegA family two-component response regulator